jgi:hypothetical protein
MNNILMSSEIFLVNILLCLIIVVFLEHTISNHNSIKEGGKFNFNKKAKSAMKSTSKFSKSAAAATVKAATKAKEAAEKAAKEAAERAKCIADKTGVRLMDATIVTIKVPFKQWWTGCWESLRTANEYFERCGLPEIEKIKLKQYNIRDNNKKCFAEWHKKLKQKQEQLKKEAEDEKKYYLW